MWSAVVNPAGLTAKFYKMVDKIAFVSVATALVDIPAVSMPIAHSLKT
jgi:hypothetical protein